MKTPKNTTQPLPMILIRIIQPPTRQKKEITNNVSIIYLQSN